MVLKNKCLLLVLHNSTFCSVDWHGYRNQSGLMGLTTFGAASCWFNWPALGTAELRSPSILSWKSQMQQNFTGSVGTLCCYSPTLPSLEGSLEVALGMNLPDLSSVPALPWDRGMWFGHHWGPLMLFLLCAPILTLQESISWVCPHVLAKTGQQRSHFSSKHAGK